MSREARIAMTLSRVAGSLIVLLTSAGNLTAGPSDTRLIDAVRTRNPNAIAALLRQKVDVDARGPDGATALHWAAHWDDVDTATVLIRAGASPDAVNQYGVTPLSVACSDAGDAMVGALLGAGANPNITSPTGETPLMAAARTGKTGAVTMLAMRGGDVNAKERERGQTALMWAVAEGHHGTVRALLAQGADPGARSRGGFSPLLFAAREGDLDMARLLLAAGADVNESDARGASVLLVATVRGHVALAEWLMENGADPNARAAGYTPLHWAAGTWESAITYDYPDAPDEWQALAGIPTREGKRALITALLARGADPNARVTREPPRHGYSLFRRSYVIGATPFHLATQVADLDTMRLLLAHGADPSLGTTDGTTPLHAAAGISFYDHESRVSESSHLDAVKLILELGGGLHAVNAAGFNALHAAAYAGFDSVVQWLVDRGVPLNDRTYAGHTALGIAEGLQSEVGRFQIRPNTAAALRRLGAHQ